MIKELGFSVLCSFISDFIKCVFKRIINFFKKNWKIKHTEKANNKKQNEKLGPSKTNTEFVIKEDSTCFIKGRIAVAFPGVRGRAEIKKSRAIRRCLSKLLEPPIQFRKSVRGCKDPIWWFRAGMAENITTFKHLRGRKFLIGGNEFVICRIVAFRDDRCYWSNYVYVEAQGERPTGLYNYTSERINEDKTALGYMCEEYAIYKPFPFFHKRVTIQEADDGSTKILGKPKKMQRVEPRCRFLTDFNFVIAAKESAYNCASFKTSEEYFRGLLDGSISIEHFHDYMMQFPKPE